MTFEKAWRLVTSGYDKKNLVAKIYEDIENATCNNCKHYVHSHNECVNQNENCYIEPHSKDFSCSLFEKLV